MTCPCEIRFGPREIPPPTPAELERFCEVIRRKLMEQKMPRMRAKLTVTQVTDNGYSDVVEFGARYSDTKEDNSYAKATPSASAKFQIDNPDLRGKIKPGQLFYVDFTPIEPTP